jgi:tetratricopeptide (TPR) repeat protein
MAAKQVRKKGKVEGGVTSFKWIDLLQERYIPYLIFIFCFVIYFNSAFNDYNLDDELVTQNHRLTSKGISAIPEIFSSPYYEDQAGYKYEYRPIVLVTFAIEHSLFGENPHVSHLINILLYAALCVYLFSVLAGLLRSHSIWFVAFIVMIFAAHPIHTEVVSSIKNRDELLALFFSLAALDVALRYTYTGKWYFLLPVAVFLYLGILSKTTALVFALLIPVMIAIFTNVGFARLMAITLLLALPALTYSRLYSVLQQLLLAATLIGAVMVLYIAKNYRELWQTILSSFKGVDFRSSAKKNADEATPLELSFSFLRNPIVSGGFALALLVWLGSVVSGIIMGNMWWVVIPMAVFAIWYALARIEFKLLLILPFTLIVCYAMFKFKSSSEVLEAPLMLFIAAQFLFIKNRYFKVVAVVSYFLYAVTALLAWHSFFFLSLPMFAMFYSPKLKPVSIVIVLLVVASILKSIYGVSTGDKSFSIVMLSMPVLLLGWGLFWYRKVSVVTAIPGFMLVALMLLYFNVAPPTQSNIITSAIQRNYYKANELKAVELTPVQSVRPLKKIEYPLEKTDPISLKLGTYMVVLGKYLKLILLPYPLSFYYGYAYILPTDFFNAKEIAIAVLHLLLLFIGLFCIKRYPIVSAGLFVYTISVIVFCGIFIPVPGMLGDRFLFIPSIGFSMILTWILFKLFKQSNRGDFTALKDIRPPLKMALASLLLVYSLVTIARNADWKDRITLFSRDINVVENSAQAQNLLGVHLLIESGRETDKAKQVQMRREAIIHFEKAIEIYPQFLNASYDLGRAHEMNGNIDAAYAAYEQAVRIDTGFFAPLFSMAIIQDQKGNTSAAVDLYEKYLKKYPNHKEVYANLSYAYFKTRQFELSIKTNQRLLQRMPNAYEPTVNIAKTYLEMGRNDSAYVYFLKSYEINPREQSIPVVLRQLEAKLAKP